MSSSLQADCIVIGAGVVGLAIARELALQGREVIILEADSRFGNGISSRNSEVIHAGIYYTKDSLKAKFCVEGKTLLYDYCERMNVPHKRTGKLIVATSPEQQAVLEKTKKNAEGNGVFDLKWMTSDEVKSLEPHIRCHSALYSPSTGIVDSHQLMLAMLGEAQSHGAMLALHSKVVSVDLIDGGGFLVRVDSSGEVSELSCKTLINSAGLRAQEIANSIQGLDSKYIPQLYLAKGHYFSLRKQVHFSHLIYPVPEDGGLGVHITLDLQGQVRFGPDVQWLDHEEYSFDESRVNAFVQSIRTYYPDVTVDDIQPSYVGIRPKLSGPKMPARDFEVSDYRAHGIRGLVNLFGIESPGLTSCFSLAKYVSETSLTGNQ